MHHLVGHGCAGSTLSICLARQLLLSVRLSCGIGRHLRGLGCASSTQCNCLVRQLLFVLEIMARDSLPRLPLFKGSHSHSGPASLRRTPHA